MEFSVPPLRGSVIRRDDDDRGRFGAFDNSGQDLEHPFINIVHGVCVTSPSIFFRIDIACISVIRFVNVFAIGYESKRE
jgi:hypothetical protein